MPKDNDFFDIDEFHLDREWIRQSRLYLSHAEKLANAKQRFEEAKSSRDVTYAELYKKIRSKPEDYDLPKVTEESLKHLIILQDDYRDADKEVITAKHTVDILQAAVDALDHKKRALENLVHLQISGYHSDPKPPKGATQDDVDKVRHPKNSRAIERTRK